MQILVSKGKGQMWEYPLSIGQQLQIGRDAECDLVLDDMDVSRRHLLLVREEKSLTLVDTSSNGTRVGVRLIRNEKMVVDGCEAIFVGPYQLRVVVESSGQGSEEDHGISVVERKEIHRRLLDSLKLAHLSPSQMEDAQMRARVLEALKLLVNSLPQKLSNRQKSQFVKEMSDEVLGLGPLETLLADASVSEIMVVDPQCIYCERKGKIEKTSLKFTDDDAARAVIERIVTPLGRRIDESTPYVDARLKDGSRVNAVIAPLALRGACITIRKFRKDRMSAEDLVQFDSLSPAMARFLGRSVRCRKNIVISGGTGSGKTTLLNVLSAFIGGEERVVTIEDAAELQLQQEHVVSLESRPPNMEGRGQIEIRDLLKNALRMRPDRILVGECRGGEAIDMLQAMNTGHDGSMTTTHANTPREAMARLETLVLMSGVDLPSRAIREQIASSVDLVVQQSRLSDGSRRVTSISEVVCVDDEGRLELREIFAYRRLGTRRNGETVGRYLATGYLPSYLAEMIEKGIITGEDYL